MNIRNLTIETLLPELLLNEIFNYWLTPEELITLSQVNTFFLNLCKNNSLWERKFSIHFPHILRQINYLKKEITDWYDLFWETYDIEYRALTLRQARLFSLAKENLASALETAYQIEKENYTGSTYTGILGGEPEPYITDTSLFSLQDWIKQESFIHPYMNLPEGFVFSANARNFIDCEIEVILHLENLLNLNQPLKDNDTGGLIDDIADTSEKYSLLDLLEKYFQYINLYYADKILRHFHKGRRFMAEFYIQKGFNVNHISSHDYQGKTVLHLAAEEGHDTIVELLLRHGQSYIYPLKLEDPFLHHMLFNFLPGYHYARYSRTPTVNPITQRNEVAIETSRLQRRTIELLLLEEFIQQNINSVDSTSSWCSFFNSSSTPSIKEQVEAAKALREVALFGGDAGLLVEHENVLNVGKLGEIYKVLRKYIPEKEEALLDDVKEPEAKRRRIET